MRITAVFKGNTSLGFVTGTRYEINLTETFPEGVKGKSRISAETFIINPLSKSVDEPTSSLHLPFKIRLRCEYSTISKFLENWEIEKFEDSPKGWSYEKHAEAKSEITEHIRNRNLKILIG